MAPKTKTLVVVPAADAKSAAPVVNSGILPIVEKPAQETPNQSPPALVVRSTTAPTIEQCVEFKTALDTLAREFLAKRPNAINLGARPTMPSDDEMDEIIDKIKADAKEKGEKMATMTAANLAQARILDAQKAWDSANTSGAPILTEWLRYAVTGINESLATLLAANPGALSGKIAKISAASAPREKREKSESSGTRTSNAEFNAKIIARAAELGVRPIMVNVADKGLGAANDGFVGHTAYESLADGTYRRVEYNVADGSVTDTAEIYKSWKHVVVKMSGGASTSVAQTVSMALLAKPGAATHKARLEFVK